MTRTVLAALATAAIYWPSLTQAAPDGGTVNGVIKLDSPTARGEPDKRGTGFTARINNPLKHPKAFDPLPDLVVVLDGGTPAKEDTQTARPFIYRLVGESFEVPVFPVLAGSTVEISNDSKGRPRLYSPDDAGLLDGEAVAPKARRPLKKFGPAYRVVEIRDRESAHLVGRIVALPHLYFARVSDDGKFTITGVPPGTWKVRIWYRDGWAQVPETSIEVTAKKTVETAIELRGRPKVTKPEAKGK